MKEFKVSNFKAVNGEKYFKLAPITLFIGPNGSGKSSILKSLEFGMKAVELRSDYNPSTYVLDFENKIDYKNPKFFTKNTNTQKIRNFITKDAFGNKTSIKEYFNRNNKSDIIKITYPINLDFFSDEFEVTFLFGINDVSHTETIPLGVEIYNKKENKFLLKHYAFPAKYYTNHQNLFGSKSENEITTNMKCLLQLDLDYASSQFENIAKYILTKAEEAKNNDHGYEDLEKEADEFISWYNDQYDKYMSDFYKLEHAFLYKDYTSDKYERNGSKLINYLTSFETENNTIDWLQPQIKDFNSKYDKFLNIKKEDTNIEDTIIQMLANFESEMFNGIVWESNKGRKSTNFSMTINYFEQEVNNLIDAISKKSGIPEHYKIVKSEYFNFIFKYVFLENIENGLNEIKYEVDNAIKIFPNRFDYGKESLSSTYKSIFERLDLEELNNPEQDKIKSIRKKSPQHFQEYWLKAFNIGNSLEMITSEDYQEIIKIKDKHGSSRLINQGFGISQLIPIITLLSSPSPSIPNNQDLLLSGSLFLIEEPEANLHPNYQSLLADMFIDASYKYRHQLLIETHSEYLVRKFQYWVAKGKILSENIIIYYFENKNDDPEIKDLGFKEIKINNDGSLSQPFGSGFFDEADKIALELFLLKKHQTN